MLSFDSTDAGAGAASGARPRDGVPARYKWNLTDIFPGWDAWQAGFAALDARIGEFAALQGSLGGGADALLRAFRLNDDLGQLAFKVWYFAALQYDEDQRDNGANAKRQQVQIQLARLGQASSWFNPELLQIPLETVRGWLDASADLRVYRFAIEDLYRQQEHVLDGAGEQLMSLSSRLGGAPNDAYSALSTADARFPTISLSTGESLAVSYAQYRRVLATCRDQGDRRKAFEALHGTYRASLNTYASLYNGVCQRDWFHARARDYPTTLDAALHGDNIPATVVENLIAATRAGVEPLRRYHRLRKRALGLGTYHVYDFSIPLVEFERKYPYDDVLDVIVHAVAPLGEDYQARMRRGFDGGWIDVYENEGKRSGAYSAPVYGSHPYMLLNYSDTLDDVFTLAHEMGHSMHTLLAHEAQPFVYSSYTIFVAEVPSTLNEALLLDELLARSADPVERVVLLQHAIDNITSTFYTQVLFADYELEAHRLVERDQPITSDILNDLYLRLLKDYYGDALDGLDDDPLTRITWARIPHFYASPYYVYQYATCFASAARLAAELRDGDEAVRAGARRRYLDLLRAGSSDHPMALLQRAGVDLSRPETVRAVVDALGGLVTRLEGELALVRSR
jgi:oligoendopeptidase F